MAIDWTMVGSHAGFEERIRRQIAFTSKGQRIALIKHEERTVAINTYEAKLSLRHGLDKANIEVEYTKDMGTYGDGIISFEADYSPITGLLLLRRTTKSASGGWVMVGTEVQEL